MSEEPKGFQFTIARLMYASAWFAMSAALFGIGYRHAVRQAQFDFVWFACCVVAIVPLGGGIGTFFGHTALGIGISVALVSLFFVVCLP